MQHLVIMPFLLPLLAGVLLILPPIQNSIIRQRIFAVGSSMLILVVSSGLLKEVMSQGTQVYSLGGWSAPYGIVLVADPLAALLVLLTSILALASILYACAGEDETGMYYHTLILLLVAGVNGAFLTGDLFNLFVCFEILLIASYALLIHGGGKHKTQASLHYVILNLVGSSIFLFALGILYGMLGTLNTADMAVKLQTLDSDETTLVKIAGLLLLIVFGLKSAMLPLHFWLPRTYAAASAPVAAMFAIMTKVGIYSIFRVHTVIFGDFAGDLANIAQFWLWPIAVLTLIAGAIGALASQNLKMLTANMILISVGTLLTGAALGREDASGASFYYLLHTTLVSAAMFLIADLIAKQRGKAADRFVAARIMKQRDLLAGLYFVAAIAMVGMPPLSGFIGKALLLQSAHTGAEMGWVWSSILFAGLASIVALSRAGTTLFWRTTGNTADTEGNPVHITQLLAILFLLSLSPLLVLFAGPVTSMTHEAAAVLHNPELSVRALLPALGE
ncbi:monovalent cation/H+ antiporter subunit D [Nitrincola tibetensis]|uniref:Monovalent cation/H+ antiporter subunit D n=1 Tax=Nitrincola tibetensis TaxID=2219697 RepID=A0A364NLD8_9GAMM|nr:monovalent cation/H+ antiporter subunit D [Nitrincola tibetensis]RAU17913.1 monovalent cation/H+ antiporter subunit D [Nitrincola tibetensis]